MSKKIKNVMNPKGPISFDVPGGKSVVLYSGQNYIVDEITPYLQRRIKKGDLRVVGNGGPANGKREEVKKKGVK